MDHGCHKQLLQLLYSQKNVMNRVYDNLSKDLAKSLKKHKLKKAKEVWRGNKVSEKAVNEILNKFSDQLLDAITDQIDEGWNLSNNCNDAFVNKYLKGITIDDDKKNSYFYRNNKSLESFKKRVSNGLILSDRVWNLTKTTKGQLESFLATGIHEGTSASKLATDLKRYLKEPNKRFRRVRDKKGKLILSNPAKGFHPGRGVYRSSYRNALRLARNEINIAYRTADYERRKQLPFVLGIEVHLSNAHPRYDICDELTGEYPLNFKFTGWHPNCICYTTSKLMKKKDFIKYLNTGKIDQKKITKTIPLNAAVYLNNNSDKLKKLKSTPYFITDNFTSTDTGYSLKKVIGNDIDVSAYNVPTFTEKSTSLSKDYKVVFNQKSEHRKNMMNYFLSVSKERKEPKLNNQQKALVFGYTKNDVYSDMNKFLRKETFYRPSSEYTSFLNSYSKTLNDSLKKLPSYKGVVYRGTNLKENVLDKYRKAYKSKKSIVEQQFLSTSKSVSMAFQGNVQFIINSKKGKSIKHLSGFINEDEVLFNVKSKFKINKILEQDGKVKIFMEEI